MMSHPSGNDAGTMKSGSSRRTGNPGQSQPEKGVRRRPEVNLNAVEGAVGYHLRRALMVILDDVGRRMGTLGLTPRDFTVMSVIRSNPGINATRIAESLPMKRSNLSVLLLRLKEQGWVRNAASEDLGRVRSLTLSPEGVALLGEASRLHREHLRFLESILGRSDMAQLIRALRKLGAHAPEIT
jgi:DNA-binding MarR family transcriptional regulator